MTHDAMGAVATHNELPKIQLNVFQETTRNGLHFGIFIKALYLISDNY